MVTPKSSSNISTEAILEAGLSIKIASEVGAQMKLRFLTLMCYLCSISEAIRLNEAAPLWLWEFNPAISFIKLLLKLSLMTCLGRTKYKFNGLGNIFLHTMFIIELIFLKKSVLLP